MAFFFFWMGNIYINLYINLLLLLYFLSRLFEPVSHHCVIVNNCQFDQFDHWFKCKYWIHLYLRSTFSFKPMPVNFDIIYMIVHNKLLAYINIFFFRFWLGKWPKISMTHLALTCILKYLWNQMLSVPSFNVLFSIIPFMQCVI